MDLTSYLPAVHQHGLLTWQQLLGAGVEPERIQPMVRAGDLVRVRRGVYTAPETWQEADEFRGRPLLRLHAARLTVDPDHVVSHDSAALLLGLGVPDGRTALVHLTYPRVRGGRIQAGVKRHGAPYRSSDLTHVDDIPTLNPARTACDMAREHGRAHGVAIASAALAAGATRADLCGVAATMKYWRGVAAVRAALPLADGRVESYLEGLALDLLHDLGLGAPDCQFELTDGRTRVRCDFRIGRHIFECDGQEKYFVDSDARSPRERVWAEKQRQDFIQSHGLGVSRIVMQDCLSGRGQALRRLAREYTATSRRFGDDIADLAPFVVRRAATL